MPKRIDPKEKQARRVMARSIRDFARGIERGRYHVLNVHIDYDIRTTPSDAGYLRSEHTGRESLHVQYINLPIRRRSMKKTARKK